MTDEFERRQSLSSFITTLADTVTKLSPSTLISKDGQETIDQAGLKDSYQAAWKGYLDMLMHFTKKADSIGSNYPIEEVLGIKEAKEAP